MEFVAKVEEVVGVGIGSEKLVDHGGEVGERADGGERGSVLGPGETTCGAENEGVLCDEQRDAAFVELISEEPVGTTNASARAGCDAIGAEEFAHVGLAFFQRDAPSQPCGSRRDGPSMRTVWHWWCAREAGGSHLR